MRRHDRTLSRHEYRRPLHVLSGVIWQEELAEMQWMPVSLPSSRNYLNQHHSPVVAALTTTQSRPVLLEGLPAQGMAHAQAVVRAGLGAPAGRGGRPRDRGAREHSEQVAGVLAGHAVHVWDDGDGPREPSARLARDACVRAAVRSVLPGRDGHLRVCRVFIELERRKPRPKDRARLLRVCTAWMFSLCEVLTARMSVALVDARRQGDGAQRMRQCPALS